MPFTAPRTPSDDERRSWLDSAAERDNAPDDKDLETLRAYVAHKHPLRWARFQQDYRHIGKALTKLGMNAEDARWLL